MVEIARASSVLFTLVCRSRICLRLCCPTICSFYQVSSQIIENFIYFFNLRILIPILSFFVPVF